MPFVLDASIVLDWALAEGHPTAAVARERIRTDTAEAPSLWRFEVRNGLVMAERQGRSTEDYSGSFLHRLARFPVSLDTATDEATVMALARRHRLTVYDAAYLELAIRKRSPLATLDGDLIRAAPTEGVVLIA
jgi:predicted nucleic acid-binding protein